MITGTNPSNIQERLCTDLLHLKVQGCVLSFGASHQTSHTTLFDMSEEKMKKKKTLECQFFFLVWYILSSSEESWTKEYSEC